MYFKHILKFVCLLVCVVLIHSTAWAQTRKVVGTIVSDSANTPLEGVTIKLKSGSTTSTTDNAGNFSINVPESGAHVLQYSHVGYENGEADVPPTGAMSISMKRLDFKMDEVVVVGYGTQKRSKLTGAVATLKAEEIEDLPVANIAAALRGRIAGLGVSQASGRPGASITLNVRGAQASSAGGVTAEPLYVIDNMIVGKGTFDNLDPAMVEDISILKDASAAIYGAAGAKGVVLVTTKKGKAGPPRLSYNGYAGLQDAVRKPEMLSAYEHARLLNDTYRINNQPLNNHFSDADLEMLKNMPNYNWFDEIWQPSLMQRHNLSISGGSDRMTFFVGGGYQNNNANYAGQKADKYTLRSGLSAKLMSGLKADVNFNVDNNVRYSRNGWSENDQAFLENMIQVPRWTPIMIGDKYVNYTGFNSGFNPMAFINSGYYQNRKGKSYGVNASLTYAPESGFLKGLVARFQASTTASSNRTDEFRPKYSLYNFVRTGSNGLLYSDSLPPTGAELIMNNGTNSRLNQSMDESSNYRVFFTLQYGRSFRLHDFSIMVGGEQSEGKGTGMGLYYTNQQIPNNDYYWAFDPIPTVNNPSASNSGKRSFFGNFNYNYAGKYTVEGTARLDASSNFAANNIWGFFPRVGAGWVISQEPFFKDNVKFVSYMKIRANLGLTGDDRVGSRYWQERYKINIGSYIWGETYVPGLRPDVIPNPDITWEKNRTFNFGIDMAFFKNKLNIGFEAFQTKNYDVFDKGNDQNFPMYAGFAAPVMNYRINHRWGTEYSISYNAMVAKDLKLTTSMNFGFGNSVMERMFYNRFNLWETVPGDEWQIGFGSDPRKYNGSNYGLIAEGMFRSQEEVDAFMSKNPGYTTFSQVPQPGWLKYKDIDGDGIITDRDKTVMFKRIDPALSTGIQIGLNYKSLDWRVNIGADIGGKQFYDSKARRSVPSPTKNVPAFWNDTWSEENTDAKFPRYDDPSINIESDFWAVDGTMIRVNDMTLGYTAPKTFVKRIGLSSARILLTANNLWVIKNPLKYKDPYSDYIYDYPTLRVISVGLNLGL